MLEAFEVPALTGRESEPLCRGQSQQGADRGSIDPQARPAFGAELLSTSRE